MRRSMVAILLFCALPLFGATSDERAAAQSRLNILLNSLAASTLATTGSAGDANGDGNVTVADIFYLINFLFTSGPPPVSQAVGDLAGEVTGPTSATVVSNAVAANTANAIVRRDAGGSFSAGSVTLAGALALPTTASSSEGVINLGGSVFAHGFGAANTFLGTNAGNLTMTGNSNTATGNTALVNATTGSRNTASGSGALFSNTTGSGNTAIGAGALASNTSGVSNTAIGDGSLFSNTAVGNTATGYNALYSNTSGSDNTANGTLALSNSSTGNSNTALGKSALASNGAGNRNTAIGAHALDSINAGSDNIGIGYLAGTSLSALSSSLNIDIGNLGSFGESGTIRIGTPGSQTRTFIAGIYNVTASGGVPVVINSAGQLGTNSSSRRVKFDIADMGDATEGLMRLRPVTFRYLAHGGNAPLQYGLIAEDVAEVYPELVARNKDGEPETVMYQFLAPMLLNEVQRQQKTIDTLEHRLEALEKQLAKSRD